MRTKTLALPGVSMGRTRYIVSVSISLPTTPKELVAWSTAGCYSVALIGLTVAAMTGLCSLLWWAFT